MGNSGIFNEFEFVEVGDQDESQWFITLVHSNLTFKEGKEMNLFNKWLLTQAVRMR